MDTVQSLSNDLKAIHERLAFLSQFETEAYMLRVRREKILAALDLNAANEEITRLKALNEAKKDLEAHK